MLRKSICDGCDYANQKREYEAGLEPRCAFCREPFPKSKEEDEKKRTERVKKNDPGAMREEGTRCCRRGDYETALEHFMKASTLGDTEAHFKLSLMYNEGLGVEKDEKKEIYHTEKAAIRGHPKARHKLGTYEQKHGRYDRARKHFIIAANLGYHDSLERLRQLFAKGNASKEDYANALRSYQAAVDATKSPERDEVEKAVKNGMEKLRL